MNSTTLECISHVGVVTHNILRLLYLHKLPSPCGCDLDPAPIHCARIYPPSDSGTGRGHTLHPLVLLKCSPSPCEYCYWVGIRPGINSCRQIDKSSNPYLYQQICKCDMSFKTDSSTHRINMIYKYGVLPLYMSPLDAELQGYLREGSRNPRPQQYFPSKGKSPPETVCSSSNPTLNKRQN